MFTSCQPILKSEIAILKSSATGCHFAPEDCPQLRNGGYPSRMPYCDAPGFNTPARTLMLTLPLSTRTDSAESTSHTLPSPCMAIPVASNPVPPSVPVSPRLPFLHNKQLRLPPARSAAQPLPARQEPSSGPRPRLYAPTVSSRLRVPTCDDGHGVHLLVDQLLRLPQQLPREHHHAGGAVAHLVVLHLADVCRVRRQGSKRAGAVVNMGAMWPARVQVQVHLTGVLGQTRAVPVQQGKAAGNCPRQAAPLFHLEACTPLLQLLPHAAPASCLLLHDQRRRAQAT